MNTMTLIIAVFCRFLLVVLFPFSALDKMVNWNDALKQANSSFLPGGPVLLILGIAVETLTPICIVIGWNDRIAAFILAGFCAVTAILYHNFWAYKDLWAKGASQGRAHFWDFLKNFGLVGGLLLIVFGGELASVGDVYRHPFSSSYTMPPARAP